MVKRAVSAGGVCLKSIGGGCIMARGRPELLVLIVPSIGRDTKNERPRQHLQITCNTRVAQDAPVGSDPPALRSLLDMAAPCVQVAMLEAEEAPPSFSAHAGP